MKGLLYLTLLVFTARAEGRDVPESMRDMGDMLHGECVGQVGIDEELIVKAREGDFSEDRVLKCYMRCLYAETGLFNDDGTLDTETLLSIIPEEDRHLYTEIIRKCGSVMGTDECETAFNTNICYYKNSPENYFLI